jgi:Zn-dependent metalloprotease
MENKMRITTFKIPVKIILTISFAFLVSASNAVSQNRPIPDSTEIQRKAVRLINERFGFRANDGSGFVVNSYGVPKGIRGEQINVGLTSSDPVERVHQFFEQNQDLFQVQNPREELVIPNFRRYPNGAVTVYVDQMVSGVKVLSGGYIVNLKSDSSETWITEIVNNGSGYIPSARNINTIPTIDSLEAGRIAMNDTDHGSGKTRSGKYQLWIANFADGPHLIWRLATNGANAKESAYRYMIDAHSGAILDATSALKY